MQLRVARAFVDYACQRSLACCRAPTRAPVDDSDRARVVAQVGASGPGGPSLAEAFEASLEPLGTFQVVGHREGACAMLSAGSSPPGCQLQDAAGLDALPEGCRNFPRSVLALEAPGAVEVAFTPRCPTVGALLVAASLPFELATVEVPGWPYLASRDAPADLALDGWVGRRLPRVELEAARTGWWALLAARAADPAALIDLLQALWEDPLHPRLAPIQAQPAIGAGVGGGAVAEVVRGFTTVPERGALYATSHWHVWAELTEELPLSRLVTLAAGRSAGLAAAASNELQWAALHDLRPLDEAARIVVRRALTALRLCAAAERLAQQPRDLAWQDGLLGASHLEVVPRGSESSPTPAADRTS